MAAVRTFVLPHYEAYPVHVTLFSDVKNADFLRSQLLAANPEFDYAFIDAAMILTPRHLLSAITHTLHAFLHTTPKSTSPHGELIYRLSPGTNIGEAYKLFGIGPASTDVVVVKLPGGLRRAKTEKEEEESKSKTEKETKTEAEKETESKTEKETESKTEKETESKTEKETESKTEKETESKTEKETESKTEKEPQTQEDLQSQTHNISSFLAHAVHGTSIPIGPLGHPLGDACAVHRLKKVYKVGCAKSAGGKPAGGKPAKSAKLVKAAKAGKAGEDDVGMGGNGGSEGVGQDDSKTDGKDASKDDSKADRSHIEAVVLGCMALKGQ